MVERSVHLAVRGLVSGIPKAEASPGSVAAPGQRARLGAFDLAFEAARPRILPGEDNELTIRWTALEPGAAADVQLVLDLPAELAASEPMRSARATLGGGLPTGEVRFILTGQEPGGVWVDAVLTLEDEMGAVLARAKAGFAVARHRVVISDVDAQPAVVAAGDAVTVRAHFAWTGASRVRGTLGGTLRRRADGAVLELHREKVSALGERTHDWTFKAPVDQQVADFDVELSFEGRETKTRAQFGKTGVFAVRRAEDAEVASVKAATARWGTDEPVEVRALVRNTGVRALAGHVTLEVSVRAPGAAEADIVPSAALPERFALAIPPASAGEAVFVVRVPRGVEGRRIEARVAAVFGQVAVEKREVLGHLVADHVLDFDGFAADRYAYSPGEEPEIECRVRDDGARPGGAFDVLFRLADRGREVARAETRVDVAGRAASVRAKLKLPLELVARGPLDLEVAVPAEGALRRVAGFLRVRQAVASRVVVVKPPQAAGVSAFLFEGERVEREEALGEVAGAGACRLVLLDSGAFFVGGKDFAPIEGPRDALERALAIALVRRVGPPPAPLHPAAWSAVLAAMATGDRPAQGASLASPSSALAALAAGSDFKAIALRAEGDLKDAIRLTGAALAGSKLPATELSNVWIAAAEGAARAGATRGSAAVALAAARRLEADALSKLEREGLDVAGTMALAQLAVLRRAAEAELLALALAERAPDGVLGLSVALKAHEERLRALIRYFARLLAKMREAAAAAALEGAQRRKLAALRLADVALQGADAILPGRYNRVTVEVRLPRESPSGGLVSAAVALPSELWIVGTETAELLRGQYLLPGAPLVPGGRAAWQLELYVPDRAGGEPGAIEVRLGFEPDASGTTAPGGGPA